MLYKRTTALPLATLSLLVLSAAAPARAQYLFTILDDPNAANINPGLGTYAYGINNQGVVVGQYYTADTTSYGFTYQNGTYTTLNDPNAGSGNYGGTCAYGINSSGVIAGAYVSAGNALLGFLDQNGTYTTVNSPLGVNGTFLTGISNTGVAYGSYLDANNITHSFLYQNGTFTYLPDDPAAGNVANTSGTVIFSGNNTELVGYYYDSNGNQLPFTYDLQTGTYTNYDLATTFGNPYSPEDSGYFGVNDAGTIVGYYSDSQVAHGVVVNNGTPTYLDVPGATDSFALSINDSGQIAGEWNTVDASGNYYTYGYLATPVPEPGNLAILGSMALAGIGFLARRQGRRRC